MWGVTAAVAMTAMAFDPVPATAQSQQAGTGGDEAQQERVEIITVSATRLPVRLSDLPTVVRVWKAEDLQRAPAIALDDALRWEPTVSLFRRTSSRDSHPTALGLNLRGLGPSGVSRALVLVDGIPINDPFGGWVYWDRVPLLGIEQIEVAPGGGSAPYGNQALGGVLQVVTRRELGSNLQLQAFGGSLSTVRFGAAVGSSGSWGSVVASGQVFSTGGYIQTAPEERGSVDTNIASQYQSGRIRFDRSGISITAEGLHENRNNGTPLQRNDTSLAGVSGAWNGTTEAGGGGWNVHGFGRSQLFNSTFSSVAADRNSERLVLVQKVPSTDLGAGGHGWRAWGDRATLSFGGDWRRVEGFSKEFVVFTQGTRTPGGIQNLGGGFVAADWAPGDAWTINLGARADGWHQNPVETPGDPRGGSRLSPRAGIAWHPDNGVTLRGAAYSAFRAPTLNELYRSFRVGSIITNPNSELEEERLRGAEVGANWDGRLEDRGATLSFSTTFYWNRLDDAVINATERVTPTLIFRRRENLGAATSRGLEIDGRVDTDSGWSFAASYAWLDAFIRSAGAAGDSSIEGNQLPQVPTYRVRGTVWYRAAAGWSGVISVGGTGEQFEDDLNQLRLAPAVVLDASIEIPLIDDVHLTIRGENLLDNEVEARRTPTLAFAAPRLIYAGITLTWPDS